MPVMSGLKKFTIRNSIAEFLIFTTQENQEGIEVQDENLWLTQKLIAKLFDVKIPTINEHLSKDNRYLFYIDGLQP